jgi:hypothetical protein
MTGDSGPPRLDQGEHDGDQGRPDEQTQKAECDEAAKDAQYSQRHRISMPKPISHGLMKLSLA